MKKILLIIARICLNMIYNIFKLLPVQKKITYISRQSNTISEDFRMLSDEMKKRSPEYKEVILMKKIGNGISGKIVYCFHMLLQMYHVATSQLVILDTYCIVVSFLKQRKDLKVIQIWHALGALKKFGYSILDKGEGADSTVAELMRMHKNYSYVCCSSEFCKPFFAEAFGVSLDKMVAMPLPRLDELKDTKKIEKSIEKILNKYPQLKERKTILYAPTFRKDESHLKGAIEEFANALDYSKYNLVVKLHPLSNTIIEHPNVIQDDDFSTTDFCQLADLIVLDYSAVLFEVLMLDKPLIFYVFDYEEYMKNRDFYIDYERVVPGKIVKKKEELLQVIEKEQTEIEKTKNFKELMIKPSVSGSYTRDMIEFMEKTLEIVNNG